MGAAYEELTVQREYTRHIERFDLARDEAVWQADVKLSMPAVSEKLSIVRAASFFEGVPRDVLVQQVANVFVILDPDSGKVLKRLEVPSSICVAWPFGGEDGANGM